MRTLAYVAEWNDPRSVWFAASRKSKDAYVHYYLGNHLQDVADRVRATMTVAREQSLEASA